jgi:hypothetical protein
VKQIKRTTEHVVGTTFKSRQADVTLDIRSIVIVCCHLSLSKPSPDLESVLNTRRRIFRLSVFGGQSYGVSLMVAKSKVFHVDA